MRNLAHAPRRLAVAVGVWLALLWAVGRSDAVEIDPTFNNGLSANPIGDSDGSGLDDLMTYAARAWENVLRESHHVAVEFYYQDLHALAPDAIAIAEILGMDGDRATDALIRVDPDYTFFYDPTPWDDSEFRMEAVLYHDLTGAEKSSWFNGSPPEVLEVGYRGTATDPTVTGYDLLTVLTHELGHVVGFTGMERYWDEVADDDIDLPASLIGGHTAAVMIAGSHTSADSDDWTHVRPEGALMYRSFIEESRKRIGALDVLGAVAGSGWDTSQVDLPRVYFLGGGDWHTAACWVDNRVPNSLDRVRVRTRETTSAVTLSSEAEALDLVISHGNTLSTGAYRLHVFGPIVIEDPATEIHVDDGGVLMMRADVPGDANDITGNGRLIVHSGGELDLSEAGHSISLGAGGGLRVEAGAHRVAVPHDLGVSGEFFAGAGTEINVGSGLQLGSGSVTAELDGTTLNVSSSLLLYRGMLTMTDSTTHIGGPVTLALTGTAEVELNGGSLEIDDSLSVGNTIEPDYGAFTQNGGELTVHGDLVVSAIGVGTFTQNGGTATAVGDLRLTESSFSTGTYHLRGGTLTVEDIQAGPGTATFNIDGGMLNLTSATVGFQTLNIGAESGYTGSFEPGHIELNVDSLCVGLEGRGMLTHAAGEITVDDTLHVGHSSAGNRVQQTGGILTAQSGHIGFGVGGSGQYDLEGGSLFFHEDLQLGVEGVGRMIQYADTSLRAQNLCVGHTSYSADTYYHQLGGRVDVIDALVVGSAGGSRGTYYINGPDLDTEIFADRAVVGQGGMGEFFHLGGRFEVAATLVLGDESGGSGRYDLTGGELSTAAAIVGNRGNGEFNHSGGSLTTTSLYVGNDGGTGNYNLSDSGTLQASEQSVGHRSRGILTQTGGINTVIGDLYVGRHAAVHGAYVQSGGTADVTGDVFLGYQSGATGNYSLSGSGTIGPGKLFVGGVLYVGYDGGGELSLEGGEFAQVAGTGRLEITAAHGTVRGGGVINLPVVNEGGLVVSEPEMVLSGAYSGSGTVTVEPGRLLEFQADADIAGPLTNDGDVELHGSSSRLSGRVFGSSGRIAHVRGVLEIACDVSSQSLHTEGNASQTSGTMELTDTLRHYGRYDLTGTANVTTGTSEIGGQFNHTSSGTHEADVMYVGQMGAAPAAYNISAGTIRVGEFHLGARDPGVVAAGGLYVDNLSVWMGVEDFISYEGAIIEAPEGFEIHMLESHFRNLSTDPVGLADLAHVTLVFESGSGVPDTLEVAGRDMGPSLEGLSGNFALGSLRLGGHSGTGRVQLVDESDNQPGWGGTEALYVDHLVLGSDGYLDLGGFNLYYRQLTDLGGTVDLNGGALAPIPEPSTLVLLTMAALALLAYAWRRRPWG